MGVELIDDGFVGNLILLEPSCHARFDRAFDGVAEQVVGGSPAPRLHQCFRISDSCVGQELQVSAVHRVLTRAIARNYCANLLSTYGNIPPWRNAINSSGVSMRTVAANSSAAQSVRRARTVTVPRACIALAPTTSNNS